ncbi:hypothetical protein ACIRLA_36175 [Streptomyces sp. NPDC102364]|uniref:hypothetical protein n=1 Tax=Streptomyces sp. NPDC102364 TaxID=3366161 RepID=UPI0037FF7BF8
MSEHITENDTVEESVVEPAAEVVMGDRFDRDAGRPCPYGGGASRPNPQPVAWLVNAYPPSAGEPAMAC